MAVFGTSSEHQVTRAIVGHYLEHLESCIESDVVIVGGGPSGLVASARLARQGVNVVLVERNNYLGGGFWIGGYLMNKLTVREPAQRVLTDIGVPMVQAPGNMWVADGPHACSKLIADACDAGVKILNMTTVEDVVLRETADGGARVAGVVINWTPVEALPRQITCVDPVAIETKVVIDCTGHDAGVVARMASRGLLDPAGYGAMWVDKSEDAIVENTKQVLPGLIVAGMAVSTMFGVPRMGPTFGGMLLSGEAAAEAAFNAVQAYEPYEPYEPEMLTV